MLKKPESFTFSYRLKSEANLAEHWRTRYNRHRKERFFLTLALKNINCQLPCKIRLIRIAPRQCDFDNLVSAFKNIRDVVADILIPGLPAGRADGDPRISFDYAQEKGKSAVRIEFIPCEEILPMASKAKDTKQVEDIIHECKKLLDTPERALAEMDDKAKELWLRRATLCLESLKVLLNNSPNRYSSNKILC